MDYFASLYSYKNVSVVLSFFSGPVKCLVPHHFISVCLIAVCYGFVISFLIFSSLFSINRVLYGSFGNRMKKIMFITLFLSISICFVSSYYSCSFVNHEINASSPPFIQDRATYVEIFQDKLRYNTSQI